MLVAVVQARMGSTRLPGKVMMEICGKPILWHVVNRLKHSKRIEKIIIATTNNVIDDKIVEFAVENNIDCYCGSEEDVLDRYYQVSVKFNFEHIVRITADCPTIDPKVVDKVIGKYIDNLGEVDYVSNIHPPTYPDGLDVEVFSFTALEIAWRDAQGEYQREHVTSFFRDNPGIFKLINVENSEDLSDVKLSVDTLDDFNFVKSIFENLYPKKEIFLIDDIIELLGNRKI